MEENLDTILLEYDRSTFIIDLRKHSKGQLYIAMEQIVHVGNNANHSQKININPSILEDVIGSLITLNKKLIRETKALSSNTYFSIQRKDEVKKRYFKGVPIKDLSLQFGCSETIIENILFNSGIQIVSNEIPKKTLRYRFKRRK